MFRLAFQNSGQNYNIQVTNKQSEEVANFKCLGLTAIGQNIHDEIKSRLNLRDPCYFRIFYLPMSHIGTWRVSVVYLSIVVPIVCTNVKFGTSL
jgi:hypothetical protein